MTKNMIGATLLSAILTLAGCANHASDAQQTTKNNGASNFQLTILHINDHHSHLDESVIPLKLETAPNVREAIEVPMGGFARITTTMRELSKTSPNVLRIHAGDAQTGDLYYSLTDGKADADLMNTVCFDSMTVGNHEFDNGDISLKNFIDFLHSGVCKTPVLSANVHFGVNSALNPRKAPNYVLPYTIVNRQGQKIGLIGITTAYKTKNSSRPDADTTFSDEVITAQSQIDALIKKGVNKIVLQTHYGYEEDQRLVKKLRDVDVVIGGDSHTLIGPKSLEKFGLSPKGPYPTIANDLDGKKVCITQAWQYSNVVGQLTINFDENGDVTQCTGTPHVLIGDSYTRTTKQRPALTPKEISSIKADIANSNVLRPTTPDAGALAILAPYKQQKDAFGSAVVATSNAVLCLRRVPGTTYDQTRSALGDTCNKNPHVIQHGGDVQQLVAEAFLQQGKAYFSADLSIINGGGARTDIRPGPVTVKDIYTILPFKNTLVRLDATGAEIKAVLEDAVDGASSSSTGAFPYSAGLRWTLNLNKPKGQRLSNLEVRTQKGQYEKFDLDKTYHVATISFLADGHDRYAGFSKITGERRLDVGLEYANTFLQYIQALPGARKTLSKLPTRDYSTQIFIPIESQP